MRKVIFFLAFFFSFSMANAQNVLQRQILLQNIQHRDTIMNMVGKKDLTDSLMRQIADYRQLTDILFQEIGDYTIENQRIKEELRKYQVLTSPDTLIFNQNLKEIGEIPASLREKVEIVNSIIELRTRIIKEEDYAMQLEKSLGTSPESLAAIREKIQDDIVEIQTLIRKIKGMNLSLLSDEQQKFFRPGLTERYNNFNKYF